MTVETKHEPKENPIKKIVFLIKGIRNASHTNHNDLSWKVISKCQINPKVWASFSTKYILWNQHFIFPPEHSDRANPR